MSQARSQALAVAALMLLVGTARAGALEDCDALLGQREAIAAASMNEEIALARHYRERVRPGLIRQAEAANANTTGKTITARPGQSPPALMAIDYAALLRCRTRAEQHLEREQTVLYRNRLGFTFYTPRGADLAGQADQIARQMAGQGCSRRGPIQ